MHTLTSVSIKELHIQIYWYNACWKFAGGGGGQSKKQHGGGGRWCWWI